MEADILTLERRVAADPGDEGAALALATARVRAGADVAVVSTHHRAPAKWSRKNGRVYVSSAPGSVELTRRTRIKAARAILAAVGIDPTQVTLTWSRHAGCSTCPCSPGYILKTVCPCERCRTGRTCGGLAAATARSDIWGTVVAADDGSAPEPKSEMEMIRDKLGIRNGGR